MCVVRLDVSPHSLLNGSQWNLHQSIDKTKNERVVEVSAPETNQEAVWEAKTPQKLDKCTYRSQVFSFYSANFLLSKKWIAPVCSWELSGQEQYVIFMKNKENHGEKYLILLISSYSFMRSGVVTVVRVCVCWARTVAFNVTKLCRVPSHCKQIRREVPLELNKIETQNWAGGESPRI